VRSPPRRLAGPRGSGPHGPGSRAAWPLRAPLRGPGRRRLPIAGRCPAMTCRARRCPGSGTPPSRPSPR